MRINFQLTQVSWVRKGNGDLIAVGDDMFISDNRFQAQRIRASDTWTLQIRSVRKEDSGDYECQVSANEPKISRIVHLRVVGRSNYENESANIGHCFPNLSNYPLFFLYFVAIAIIS